jgi:hypothetical protein
LALELREERLFFALVETSICFQTLESSKPRQCGSALLISLGTSTLPLGIGDQALLMNAFDTPCLFLGKLRAGLGFIVLSSSLVDGRAFGSPSLIQRLVLRVDLFLERFELTGNTGLFCSRFLELETYQLGIQLHQQLTSTNLATETHPCPNHAAGNRSLDGMGF